MRVFVLSRYLIVVLGMSCILNQVTWSNQDPLTEIMMTYRGKIKGSRSSQSCEVKVVPLNENSTSQMDHTQIALSAQADWRHGQEQSPRFILNWDQRGFFIGSVQQSTLALIPNLSKAWDWQRDDLFSEYRLRWWHINHSHQIICHELKRVY